MKSSEIEKYSLASRGLHWGVALMIIGLFGLGLWIRDLDYYSSWYQRAPQLHVLIGLVLALLMVVRVALRLRFAAPKPLAQLTKLEAVAAYVVHLVLYLFIFVLIVSGYLIVVAGGEVMNILGLFELPVMESLFDDQEDLAGDIHEWLAWTLIVVAAVHGLAALKHHFVSGDDTLRRML